MYNHGLRFDTSGECDRLADGLTVIDCTRPDALPMCSSAEFGKLSPSGHTLPHSRRASLDRVRLRGKILGRSGFRRAVRLEGTSPETTYGELAKVWLPAIFNFAVARELDCIRYMSR